MPKLNASIFLLVFLVVSFNELEAMGLRVSPAGLVIHNVTPGNLYNVYKETGVRLTIYNDDVVSHRYLLSTHRPSERGKWEKGYLEIPDSRWVWFEKGEISVGANKKGYGNIYLKIPDKEKYYNQHWIVTLEITGEPGQGGIGLAIDVRVQIETKSKSEIKGKPDGIIAFKPSTVSFKNIPLGDTRKAEVIIYNNDNKSHTYRIIPLLHTLEKAKQRNYLTDSYHVIPETKWLSFNRKELKISAHSSGRLFLKINVPEKSLYDNKKWEEILLVKPDKGLPGFIRVQVTTRQKKDK